MLINENPLVDNDHLAELLAVLAQSVKQPFKGSSFLELARELNINGEFDPGSGRTLAACLTHASRTVNLELAPRDQWRTGE